MKNKFFISLTSGFFIIFFSTLILRAQSISIADPVMIDSSFNLYKSGNIYLSGQPTRENFDYLKDQGIKLVINIRTEPEMEKFAKEKYDESSYLKEKGIEYLQIGVGGTDGFKPEIINAISAKIGDQQGKVLIHCGSAARATLVWMAWLVKNKYCTLDEAIRLGEKARFSFPLSGLLGYPVHMEELK